MQIFFFLIRENAIDLLPLFFSFHEQPSFLFNSELKGNDLAAFALSKVLVLWLK